MKLLLYAGVSEGVMRRMHQAMGIAVVCLLVGSSMAFVVWQAGLFGRDFWEREHPLVHAIRVKGVDNGALVFEDGRTVRPAGVKRSADVSQADFDDALRVITAQGITVTRDLADGRAFMVAEPKFYNWCGTRNRDGSRWAGSYLPCPVSELLICAEYAEVACDENDILPRERWRLDGAQFMAYRDSPQEISIKKDAFRFDGYESYLVDYDASLEVMWKPPPESP